MKTELAEIAGKYQYFGWNDYPRELVFWSFTLAGRVNLLSVRG